uniref:Signal transducer and activator of transcription 6, interleukin-4 induced n=1 Tax=Scophthalmus maximus TaxID=52904 RepID=A0A8D3DIG3_SCOMX
MSQLIQRLSDETINNLYPPTAFPIEVRHFLADWIETQRWDDFVLDQVEQEGQARALLDQIISMLQSIAQQNVNVVVKMKLMQISRTMTVFQQQTLQFAVMVRDILRKERVLLNTHTQIPNPPQFQQYESRESSFPNMQDVDHLVLKVLEVQDIRQKMHQLQEELNWERQNYEGLQGGTHTLMHTLFTSSLSLYIVRCEQLLGVNGKLRQELMLIVEPIPDLQERLRQLLQVLIQSSLVVDKQPPQVIKTQSKFSTTVRYLLGEKIAPGKPVVLKAQIINELQARNLGSVPGDNVGELINNTAILEHNTSSKSTCATFRNMSIKKIKRADRKGSESVTEEKFALLFSAEITITGCDTPYRIQMISLPVVVIVHGSQDNNALATIMWDCAFSEPDRVPFVVPERVPWRMMYSTLNSKFIAEVQTQHNLDHYNQHFLAQKIFDKPDFADDFSNMMVSWAQFNKEVLPGRPFTFWQWFEGVMELTKKHLKIYWSEGLIFGFIGKQHLHLILKDRPNGTFLLRFSDSEIGGITIAYVSATESKKSRISSPSPREILRSVALVTASGTSIT